MPALRPLTVALGLCLTVALAHGDADAQRRSAAKKPPAEPALTACTDFYTFVNKPWLDANVMTQPGSTRTAMLELQQRAVHQQVELLNDFSQSAQMGVPKLLGDFWASGLDEAAVERDGAAPIAPLLSRIDAIRRDRDIPAAVAALHQVGIPVLFNFTADIDVNDLKRHMGYFTQGGLGLPDPAWYTRTDAQTRAIVSRYHAYIKQILTLTGTPPEQLDASAAAVFDIETRIAQASRPLPDLRLPSNTYAPVAVAALGKDKQFRKLQLTQFLAAQGVTSDTVSLANPQLFAQLNTLLDTLKPDQWKAYLRYHVGAAMAPYLSRAWRDADFQFRGQVLRGETQPLPRQQQVLDAINLAAGPMLGREYIGRYLPDTTRQRAELIATQVRDALGRGIANASWMGPDTKAEAQAKLAKLSIEIAAPRYDLDYSIQPMGRGSFGSNMLIASTWRHQQEMRRIGAANAARRWNVLPQQPALAYDLAHNRLIVTAAVLQAPVLDLGIEGVGHYGSFGALVGHELSHGFDDKGRMVDAAGAVRPWWSPTDIAAWSSRANQLSAQYNGYPYPGITGNVNGQLTRDENLADLAGLELAWDALNTAQPGLAPAATQPFFNAWSRLWPQQSSTDVATYQAATSLHAPGLWRTNGPLRNLPQFATAYGCKPDSPMQAPAASRVLLWSAAPVLPAAPAAPAAPAR